MGDPADEHDRAWRLPAVLAGVCGLALWMRWLRNRTAPPALFATTDNLWYYEYGRSVAAGQWGRLPALGGGEVVSVRFPPLFPWILGLGQRALWFAEPLTAQKVVAGVVGASTAPLVAWFAYRLTSRAASGARLAIAAAAGLLIAVHPLAIGASTSLMAEALAMPLLVGGMLALDAVTDGAAPQHRRAPVLALGVVLAAAALTRSDGLLLLGGATIVTLARRRLWRPLVTTLVVAGVPVVAVATVTSMAAGRPVFVATNTASVVAGASCDASLRGTSIGYWSLDCLLEVPLDDTSAETQAKAGFEWTDPFGIVPQLGPETEADLQGAQVRYAWAAVRHRPLIIARAVPFRLARGAGVYWGGAQPAHEFFEGRDLGWERAGRWFHIVVVLPGLAALGVAAARPRSRPGLALRSLVDPGRLSPIATTLVLWGLSIAATYGSTRLRASVDPLLALLATLGGAAVVQAVRRPA